MGRILQRLFNPASIAVIGGGNWCSNVIKQARLFGYSGAIWPVHPTKSQISGETAYRSIADLPAAPDASFIGINRHATIRAVAELAQQGAGGAVCFASGFLEATTEDKTSADLQHDLLNAAGKMPILGPNCYGFINYLDGAMLWPDQQGGKATKTGVAIVTQSSNIAINITMQRRGLPIGMLVTAGNQAQTGIAQIGAHLLADPRITALGLHIEGIHDISAFETLSTLARKLNKPVVALKVGQSSQARAATLSHTASLAGSDAGAGALLKRLAIARVHTLPDFIEALKLLHVTGPLRSNHIASLSCSGGEASLIADMALSRGIHFPPLSNTQKSNLRATLGPMVNLANPLDYHTYIWNDATAMADTFSAMASRDLALCMLISDFPRADRCDPADWDCVITAVVQAHKRTGLHMAIVASLPENMPEAVAAQLIQQGIAPLCGLSGALTAARVAADCGAKRDISPPVLLPLTPVNPRTLPEAQAKTTLASFGLQIPRSVTAQNATGLSQLAGTLTFPLVLKGQGHAHKTEAGAVALNLTTPEQVSQAAQNMRASTFLLEEMITGVVAELIIGVVLDPAHGYVLTIGSGGTLAEMLDDTVSLLIPTTAKDIKSSLISLKINQLLQGYRGQPAADIPAIIAAVLSLQEFVIANHGRLAEVEVNPLLCLPEMAIAADALIQIGDPV